MIDDDRQCWKRMKMVELTIPAPPTKRKKRMC